MHLVPEHQDFYNSSNIGHAYMRNNYRVSQLISMSQFFTSLLRAQGEGWLIILLCDTEQYGLWCATNQPTNQKTQFESGLYSVLSLTVNWIWGSVFLICKVDMINPTLTVFCVLSVQYMLALFPAPPNKCAHVWTLNGEDPLDLLHTCKEICKPCMCMKKNIIRYSYTTYNVNIELL